MTHCMAIFFFTANHGHEGLCVAWGTESRFETKQCDHCEDDALLSAADLNMEW